MTVPDEQMVIPVSWFQRLTRNQLLTLLGVLAAACLWVYDMNGDLVSMKERLARTEAKIEIMEKESAQRDKATSVTMAELGISLISINERLKAIETNVRRMAQ
jgi:hypothetical protein